MYIYRSSLKSQNRHKAALSKMSKESVVISLHNVNTRRRSVLLLETTSSFSYLRSRPENNVSTTLITKGDSERWRAQQVGQIQQQHRVSKNVHKCRQHVELWEIVLQLIKTPYIVLQCVKGQTQFNSQSFQLFQSQICDHDLSWTFSSDFKWTLICSRLWLLCWGSFSPTQWLGGLGKTLGEGGSLNFAPA